MEETEQCKVFVGGVSWVTTEDALKEHFSKYGTVSNAVIARDRITGSPRGFAFVTFTDPSAVAKALEEDFHNILGRTVDVKRAIPKGEQNENQLHQSRLLNRNCSSDGRSQQFRTKKIFVGGLSHDLTEDEFKKYFEQYGNITDIVVMHDNVTQRSRGFGFITFDSEDVVEDVMLQNFHELGGKQVEVKKAVPKDGGSNVRSGGGVGSNFKGYQKGNFQPYSPRYNLGHTYGALSWYGVIPGPPYGAGLYGGGYPNGGYYGNSYWMHHVGYGSPWVIPATFGVRGSPLPYNIGAANTYSARVNGDGIMGTAPNGKSAEHGTGNAQLVADRTSNQIEQANS